MLKTPYGGFDPARAPSLGVKTWFVSRTTFRLLKWIL